MLKEFLKHTITHFSEQEREGEGERGWGRGRIRGNEPGLNHYDSEHHHMRVGVKEGGSKDEGDEEQGSP